MNAMERHDGGRALLCAVGIAIAATCTALAAGASTDSDPTRDQPAAITAHSASPPPDLDKRTGMEVEAENSLSLSKTQRTEIQRALNRLGHDSGPADGIFGPRTRRAISSWQRQEGVRAIEYGYLTDDRLYRILDCVRLDGADALEWEGFRSGAGIVSEISLASTEWLANNQWTDRPVGGGYRGNLVRAGAEGCQRPVCADYASIVDACRDAASGRVHTILHTGSGQYSEVQIWSIDPATGTPRRDYTEGWVDSYREGKQPMAAADGRCLWKERQADRRAVADAVAALRVGEGDASLAATDVLQVRPLAARDVRRWLLSLEGRATVEGAVYADGADRDAWRVVQIRGDAICDAHGVVLVLDRQNGRWYAIYDIASGCTRSLDYPFRGMRVSDGRLAVSACIECSDSDVYAKFSIDLETWRVRGLGPDGLPEWDLDPEENPRIDDVERDVLGD